MKKAFFYIVMGFIMMSCGGGHHEYPIKVESVSFTDRLGNNYDYEVYPDDSELTQVFTVVPGNYIINADYHTEGISSGATITLPLKLKLLRPVEIKEDMLSSLGTDIKIGLLDANDKFIYADSFGYEVEVGPLTVTGFLHGIEYSKTPQEEKLKMENDALQELKEFLESPAGTEKEIVFGGLIGGKGYDALDKVANIEVISRAHESNNKLKLHNYYWKFKE